MILALLPALAAPLGLVAGVGVIAEPPDTVCPGRAEVAGALAERVPDEVVGWYAWYRVDPGEAATTLLPKLNRHHEALEEIGHLLAEPRGRERAAELRFLRGNIYREVLEDFGSAERDYAAAEAAEAPHVGDATFFRGVCLQALGRGSQARASLERYLASGSQRFADEVRRRLARLAR